MDSKGLLQSKTIWFSASLMALGIVEWFLQHQEIVQSLVTPQYAGLVITAIGLIAGVLRLVTKGPVSLKP